MMRVTTLYLTFGLLAACDPSPSETEAAQNPPGDESATTDTTQADDMKNALAAIAALEAALKQEKDEREALHTQVTELEGAVADLQSAIGKRAKVTELAGLKESVASHQSAIESLQTTDRTMSEDIGSLETDVDNIIPAAYGTKLYVDESKDAIAAAKALVEYVSVKGSDVIVDGANLHIRSGAGRTDAAPNGLGNLVIGYNEPLAICQMGPDDDNVCIDASDCEGSCHQVGTPTLTGSHNLILGPRHQYSSHSCLLVGDGESREEAEAPYCAKLP